MHKAAKAVLLSVFVFPGVGHFFLKKHLTGTVLTGTALASLFLVSVKMLERALMIGEKIQRGEVQFDVGAITELLAGQPNGTDAQLLSVAWTVLILTWLIGIADSYRVGHRQDKSGAAKVTALPTGED